MRALIGVARGTKGATPPKLLANLVLLCCETLWPKPNAVAHIYLKYLPPKKLLDWRRYRERHNGFFPINPCSNFHVEGQSISWGTAVRVELGMGRPFLTKNCRRAFLGFCSSDTIFYVWPWSCSRTTRGTRITGWAPLQSIKWRNAVNRYSCQQKRIELYR